MFVIYFSHPEYVGTYVYNIDKIVDAYLSLG